MKLLDQEAASAMQWLNKSGGKLRIHFVQEVEESMQLNSVQHGAIIISASGMCDAGRIRHHLRNHLWRPQTTVLLIGYQAPGTLGRLLQDGASQVKIMGEEIQVKRTNEFSEHFDINYADVYVRRGPGTYRSSCYPAAF